VAEARREEGNTDDRRRDEARSRRSETRVFFGSIGERNNRGPGGYKGWVHKPWVRNFFRFW
jgi:hypothetical protein